VRLPAEKSGEPLPETLERLRKHPETLGLEERVRLFRYPMERRLKPGGLLPSDHPRAGRLLAEALLPTEARKHLAGEGIRQLAIVPDGILHHVPFPGLILAEGAGGEARYATCRYLIHDYAVTCIPSAMALSALRKAAAGRRPPARRRDLLAVADPVFNAADPRWPAPQMRDAECGMGNGDGSISLASAAPPGGRFRSTYYADLSSDRLPFTADEALAVASLFPDYEVHEAPEPSNADCGMRNSEWVADPTVPITHYAIRITPSKVFLGLAATKARLRSLELEEFRYLLFATHALIDEENPMLSCIRLTPADGDGGFLQAHEIFELELQAEMVTLSGCQSGLGQLASGEGIVGLSMAFFSAGARSLLTSLWPVHDEPTARLIEQLHANLRAGGLSRAEALRRAQLGLLRSDPRCANPYYWAFTLLGDWGAGRPADSLPAASH
jgi:CHAT domain-containing protein